MKHRSLDRKERCFLPLQDLRMGLMPDAEDLYQLNGGELAGRKNEVGDFRKKARGEMH